MLCAAVIHLEALTAGGIVIRLKRCSKVFFEEALCYVLL